MEFLNYKRSGSQKIGKKLWILFKAFCRGICRFVSNEILPSFWNFEADWKSIFKSKLKVSKTNLLFVCCSVAPFNLSWVSIVSIPWWPNKNTSGKNTPWMCWILCVLFSSASAVLLQFVIVVIGSGNQCCFVAWKVFIKL